MVRDSLAHAFVPGADLWAHPEAFSTPAAVCAGVPLTRVPHRAACRAFLASSEKASLEWAEEVEFDRFERTF
jgi:adenosine deaminase